MIQVLIHTKKIVRVIQMFLMFFFLFITEGCQYENYEDYLLPKFKQHITDYDCLSLINKQTMVTRGFGFWSFNIPLIEQLQSQYFPQPYREYEQQDGQLLYLIYKPNTNKIFSFGYKFLDYEKREVHHIINAYDNDETEISIHYQFPSLLYEGRWIFHLLTFEFDIDNNESFNVQISRNEKKRIVATSNQEYNLIIGGYGYISNLNLGIFQGRLSKIISLKNNDYKDYSFEQFMEECSIPDQFNEIQIIDIVKGLEVFSGEKIYQKYFQHSGSSYYLSGWVQYEVVSQYKDVYTLLRLSGFQDYSKEQKLGDDLFVFEVELNNKIPQNSKIIITTDAYSIPLSQTFINQFKLTLNNNNNQQADAFQSKKVIQNVENNLIYEGLIQWHYLQYEFLDDQETNKMHIKISFFNNLGIIEEYLGNEIFQGSFTNSMFYLIFGRDNFNNVNFQGKIFDFRVIYQYEDSQFLFFKQPCDKTCQTCDGPLQTNCLSCYENQNREYLSGLKICKCQDEFIETTEGICQTINFLYPSLSIGKYNTETKNFCQIGQFRLPKSDGTYDCKLCPQQFDEKGIACFDCIIESKTWYLKPICKRDLVKIKTEINTPFFVKQRNKNDYDVYLIGDQRELELYSQFNALEGYKTKYTHLGQQVYADCKFGQYVTEDTLDCYDLYDVFCEEIQTSQSDCSKCVSGYYTNGLHCYKCPQLCTECFYDFEMEGLFCTSCITQYGVLNGECIQCGLNCLICKQQFNNFEQINYLKCLKCQDDYNYYIEMKGSDCILKLIENCLISLQTLNYDFTQNSLDLDFTISIDQTNFVELCAACLEGYMFVFEEYACVKIENEDCDFGIGQFSLADQKYLLVECLISSNRESSISQIQFSKDCNLYISKCVSCLQTDIKDEYFCLLCANGYYASKLTGQCEQCPEALFCSACIQQEKIYLSHWKNHVRAFYRRFIERIQGHSFIKFAQSQNNEDYMIQCSSCQEGYILYNNICIPYCSFDCAECIFFEGQYQCAKCNPIAENFYPQILINNQCIECPKNCLVCWPRTKDEIKSINPLFNNDKFLKYSHHCIVPIQENNLVQFYDEDFGLFLDCDSEFSNLCQNSIFLKLQLYEFQEYYETDLEMIEDDLLRKQFQLQNTFVEAFNYGQFIPQYQNEIFYEIANRLTIRKIVISIKLKKRGNSNSFWFYPLSIKQKLTENIFSLRQIELEIDFADYQQIYFPAQQNFTDFTRITLNNLKTRDNLAFKFISQFEQEIEINQFQASDSLNFVNFLQFHFMNIKSLKVDQFHCSNYSLQNEFVFNFQSNIKHSVIELRNIVFYDIMFDQSNICDINLPFESTVIMQNIQLQATFVNSKLLYLRNQIQFLVFRNLQFNQTIFENSDNFLEFSQATNISLNNLTSHNSKLKNTHLINVNQVALIEDVIVNNCFFMDNSSFFYNSNISNFSIIDVKMKQIFFEENFYQDMVKFIIFNKFSTAFSQLEIENIQIKNNYITNSEYLKSRTQEKLSLTFFELDTIVISGYTIERGPGFIDFYFQNIQTLNLFKGVVTQTKYFFKGLHQNINCQLQFGFGKYFPSSIFIFTAQNLLVQDLLISQVQVYDFSVFSYYSAILNDNNQKQNLTFNLISLQDNILLQTEPVTFIALMSFLCYYQTLIVFSNSNFLRNIYHLYEENLYGSSAGLIAVSGQLNKIRIFSSIFQENIVTNGSNSILFLSGYDLQLQGCKFYNNSMFIYDVIKPNLLWGYDDQQSIMQEILSNIFKIKSKSGIGLFKIETIFIENITVDQAQGYNGGCFSIETQNKANIAIYNSSFSKIRTLFQKEIENGGIFYIEALSTFKLKIEIVNITANLIFCKSYGGLLYLASQSNEITIIIEQVIVKDIYSQLGAIIYSQFQPYSSQKTICSIYQLFIQNSQDGYFDFLNQYKSITSKTQFISLMNNRTLIYLENCEFAQVQLLKASYLIYESLINSRNTTNLELNQIEIMNSKLANNLIYYTGAENKISIFYLSQCLISNVTFKLSTQTQTCLYPNYIMSYKKFICLTEEFDAPQNLEDAPKLEYFLCTFSQMIEQLDTSQATLISLLELNQKSYIKFSDTNINSTQCQICKQGLIYFSYNSEEKLQINQIENLVISNSQCGSMGCFVAQNIQNNLNNRLLASSANNSKFYELIIMNYECFSNLATIGTCLNLNQIQTWLIDGYFRSNTAISTGGAVYLSGNHQVVIENTVIENNTAYIGGGIYSKNQNSLQYHKLNTKINSNNATFYGFNQVTIPQQLALLVSGKQLETKTILHKANETIDQVQLKQYQTFYGSFSNFIKVPTGQSIYTYKFYDRQHQLYINSNLSLRIIAQTADLDTVKGLNGSNCSIKSRQIESDDSNQEFTNNYTNKNIILFDSETETYNLDDLIIYFQNDDSQKAYLQLEFQCTSIQIPVFSNEYPFQILSSHSNYQLRANFKTYQCQFGEINNLTNFACEKCDETLGLYSLILNQKKCNIINEVNTIQVKNNKLNLRINYWRPYFDTDEISYCLNLPSNCLGGWFEGDNSCYLGHIGALCEQCDLYNIRGEGRFSLSEQFSCGACQDQKKNSILIAASIIITITFLFISVQGNLKNIEQNHRFKPIQRSILTILATKTQSSILMKMFTNYLQIIASITTFQLQFPIGFQRTINIVGNPIQTATYSLDCFLTDMFNYDIQYGRMIWQVIMPIIYNNLFLLVFALTTKLQLTSFNSSVITTTLIYMFIYFQPNLMGGFVQLLSYRNISGFKWIQSNVAQRYDTMNHYRWVLQFCLPMVLILSFIIPIYLFFGLYKNRDKFEKRATKLHWGYLYNEYKFDAFYWEIVKIIEKTLIILSLNYYQDDIAIKGVLVLFITYLYQELNSSYQPYYLFTLNKLDYYSANVCMITVSLAIGVYICQVSNISELQIPFFIVMAILNFRFLLQIFSKMIGEYIRNFESVLDELRDMIRKQFPNIKSRFLNNILSNKTKQRKAVIQKFQKAKKILIPMVRLRIQTCSSQVQSQRFTNSNLQISAKEIETMKISDTKFNQSVLLEQKDSLKLKI